MHIATTNDPSARKSGRGFIAASLWVALGVAAAAFLLWKSTEGVAWSDVPVMLILVGVFLLRHWEAVANGHDDAAQPSSVTPPSWTGES